MALFKRKKPQSYGNEELLEKHEAEHVEDEALKLVHESWRVRMEERIGLVEAEVEYIKRRGRGPKGDKGETGKTGQRGETGKGAK